MADTPTRIGTLELTERTMSKYWAFLEKNRAIVESWPDWKRNITIYNTYRERPVRMNTTRYAHEQGACDKGECLHCIRQENQRLREEIEVYKAQLSADIDNLEDHIAELEAMVVP